MAERIDAEIDADPMGHEWVIQATISVDSKTAKRADFRQSFRAEAGMRIDALEVTCHYCRRPWGTVRELEVAEIARAAAMNSDHFDPFEPEVLPDLSCPAKMDNTHLIGGDPGVRAKRKVYEPVGTILHNVIDRRGMAGYTVHAGR